MNIHCVANRNRYNEISRLFEIKTTKKCAFLVLKRMRNKNVIKEIKISYDI